MSQGDTPKSKLIIDEDWKSQVQREKEELEEKKTAPPDDSAPGGQTIPPASFPMLCSTLATQALVSMGQIPNPMTGQPSEIDLEQAKHFVDTLQVLQDKTKGNLTPEESGMLENLLHELRLGFVAMQRQAAAAPTTSQKDT